MGSLAWRYHGILLKTLEELGGKYVLCDQCAFGLKDLDTGRLICKTTGWLSNCEPLLNHIGKRCRCKPGTHQCLVPTQWSSESSSGSPSCTLPSCLQRSSTCHGAGLQIIRVHAIPRRHLFVPLDTTGVPVPGGRLSGIRNTEAHFTNGDPAVFEMDDWREQDRARAELPGEWVGRSVFSKAEQPELQSSSPEKPKADPKRGEFLKRRRAKTDSCNVAPG